MEIATKEDFDLLAADVQGIKEDMAFIKEQLGEQEFFGVPYLAIVYGVAQSTVRNCAWLMPNFGKGDMEHPRRWKLATIQKWLEITPEERKRQWANLR